MKEETKTDRFLVSGVIVLVILVFLSRIMPTSPTLDSIQNEALLKKRIQESEKVIERLTRKNDDLARNVDSLKVEANKKAEVVTVIKTVYKEAVEATDLRPDSITMAQEISISRKMIVAQESHINALLALNLEADSLLGVRLEIIQEQQGQLQDWSDRFDNMVAQKDDLIKKERRKGHKKFIKGALVGSVVTLILVII